MKKFKEEKDQYIQFQKQVKEFLGKHKSVLLKCTAKQTVISSTFI